MTDVEALSVEDARTLTDRIKIAVEGTWQLIREAYVSRAWAALGYQTWDAYVDAEFRSARLALPREERAETIQSLRSAGMSVRAISSATGVGVGTVHRELSQQSNVPNGTMPDRVTTTDGRSYPASRPTPPPAPEPRPTDDDLMAGADWYQPDEPAFVAAVTPIRSDPAPAPAPAGDPLAGFTDDERDLHKRLIAGETVVVSMRCHQRFIAWADSRGLYERIDRRSPWGNPFELPGDGTRAEVIANYEQYYLPYKPSLLDRLHTLKGKALGCWCAPEPCHGDVLKNGADEL